MARLHTGPVRGQAAVPRDAALSCVLRGCPTPCPNPLPCPCTATDTITPRDRTHQSTGRATCRDRVRKETSNASVRTANCAERPSKPRGGQWESKGDAEGGAAGKQGNILDDALWPITSALIDDACGATGNALVVCDRFGGDSRVRFKACYYRGERNGELEQYYFRIYHHRDERVPRIRHLPDSLLVHTPDLYTEHEKKTSPAYNETLDRTGDRKGLAVRLDGPGGTSISWVFASPCQPGGWRSHHIEMTQHLVPHLRKFVHVRELVANVQDMGPSVSGSLENAWVGVIYLNQQGRVPEANDRALEILRRGDALTDRNGYLGAWLPEDNPKLQKLPAGALPHSDGQAPARSMITQRSGHSQRLVLCKKGSTKKSGAIAGLLS